jgi:uncharacterized protein (DUF983 family)
MTNQQPGNDVEQRNADPLWILSVATRAACPRCGKGKLFDGFLTLAKKCNVCGLDYSFADPADGPAFFSMMGMAIPAAAFAVWLELTYEPPLWVHLVTTLPVTLLLCVPPLRFLKAGLVASQYVNKAEEARFTIETEKPSGMP